jgi:hypothetical protein
MRSVSVQVLQLGSKLPSNLLAMLIAGAEPRWYLPLFVADILQPIYYLLI